jgi:tetratricopeptide (TPR) repeat protein
VEENKLVENNDEIQEEVIQMGCACCGKQELEEGYVTPLCKECRQALVKRPIPLWIKGVSGVVVAIMLAAFFQFPSALGAGIHYEKGIKAENQKKYVTAVAEFTKAAQKYSDSTLIHCKLYIAYYYNEQIDEAYKEFNNISGKSIDSEEVLKEVNAATASMGDLYFYSDKLGVLLKKLKNSSSAERVTEELAFIKKNPKDVYAKYLLANDLYDVKRFDDAIKYCDEVITLFPTFNMGYCFEAAAYREKAEYETAIEMCNKALQNNYENAEAYVSLSKIELKRNHNKEGLTYAKKACLLNKQNDHALANLALAYHYNKMVKERDNTIKQMKKEKRNAYEIQMVSDIISGKNKWR